MIYLNNDSVHYQTVYIPRQSVQYGTTRNPDYGSGLTSGDVMNLISESPAFSNVQYNSTDKKIYFYNGDGELLAPYVDCTDFIKDGMVSNVYIENGNLVIVFNTDAGKEDIVIPLTDIFNPDNYYTKQQTDARISAATSGLQETLVSGENIKTINEQSILGSGDIHIDGASYSAGTNIEITEENVINVTGITVPTKTSDLTNDSGYVDSGDVASQISSATADMATTGDLASLKTEIEGEIPDVSNFVTSAQVETQITNKGYVTSGDVASQISSATSDFVTSGDVNSQINSALTDYSTTSEMNEAIASAKTEVEAEIPDVSAFVTSGDVETQITDKGYITSGDAESQISSALTDYYTSAQTESAITQATSGFTTSGDVNNQINSALTDYYTSAQTESAITSATQNFVTSGDVASQINSALTGYSTTEQVNQAIQSAKTEVESEIPDVSNFVTSGDVETQITNKGYVTSGDVASQISSATSDFVTSGDVNSQINSALTDYSTTSEMNEAIASAKTEVEAEIPDVSAFVTSGDVETQITDKGYITSGDAESQISSALTDYYTSAQTESAITQATSGFTTSGDVNNQINSALTDYYTSAQTESAITSATQNFVTSGDVASQISSATSDFVTSAQVETQITGKGYVTSGQVQTQIDNRVDSFEKTTARALNYLEDNKQDELVSGTNIKTVNNQSLLGSGNIEISAGTTYSAGTNIDITNDVISVTGITVPTKTSDLTNDSGFVTSGDVNNQITAATQNLVTTGELATVEEVVSTAINELKDDIPDVSGFVTSGEVNSQISSALTDYYTSGQTESAITSATSGFTTSGDVNSQINSALTDYYTSAQTQSAITSATANLVTTGDLATVEEVVSTAVNDLETNKQDTLVSGTNIKTINNQSILGSGNIEISGGSGGGETVVELTKAQYEALTGYAENTTYIITDADAVDIDDFATTGALATLQSTVNNKADKASVTANTLRTFPKYNAQGIITGTTGSSVYLRNFGINGTNYYYLRESTNSDLPNIFAPTSAGTAGQPLVSNGSGAPTWASFKFWFGTQAQYDAITTKDSTTIYFITD